VTGGYRGAPAQSAGALLFRRRCRGAGHTTPRLASRQDWVVGPFFVAVRAVRGVAAVGLLVVGPFFVAVRAVRGVAAVGLLVVGPFLVAVRAVRGVAAVGLLGAVLVLAPLFVAVRIILGVVLAGGFFVLARRRLLGRQRGDFAGENQLVAEPYVDRPAEEVRDALHGALEAGLTLGVRDRVGDQVSVPDPDRDDVAVLEAPHADGELVAVALGGEPDLALEPQAVRHQRLEPRDRVALLVVADAEVGHLAVLDLDAHVDLAAVLRHLDLRPALLVLDRLVVRTVAVLLLAPLAQEVRGREHGVEVERVDTGGQPVESKLTVRVGQVGRAGLEQRHRDARTVERLAVELVDVALQGRRLQGGRRAATGRKE
jgi:hypothetical protein